MNSKYFSQSLPSLCALIILVSLPLSCSRAVPEGASASLNGKQPQSTPPNLQESISVSGPSPLTQSRVRVRPQMRGLAGTGRIPAGPLYGLTLDSVDNVSQIVTSLGKLSKRPTTRVVFDEKVPATEYTSAVTSISKVSYVMGEILDSFFVQNYSLDRYTKRVQEYLATLSKNVDIWEVGNEVNGEWLGETTDVVNKISSAYDLVRQKGGVTELTLYYNEGCYSDPSHEMFTWAAKNVPEQMKQGLDYVLISYYEDDCNDLQPDWQTAYARLAKMFPHSRIGFGEVGTKFNDRKNEFLNRYYAMTINQPHYIGGYFWWYGSQDLVPYTNSYWSVFNSLISHR